MPVHKQAPKSPNSSSSDHPYRSCSCSYPYSALARFVARNSSRRYEYHCIEYEHEKDLLLVPAPETSPISRAQSHGAGGEHSRESILNLRRQLIPAEQARYGSETISAPFRVTSASNVPRSGTSGKNRTEPSPKRALNPFFSF